MAAVLPSPSRPAPPPPPVWHADRAPATGYGGLAIRAVAGMIDGIAVGAVAAAAIVLLGSKLAIPFRFGPEFALASVLVGWLYFGLLESSDYGATLGKWILGLRVVDDQGGRISFLRASGRFFAKFISALILTIGFIMVALTDRKRALHDILAGTLVVTVR
ncbi:MAG: RDD family protein [Reyranella sp.]|uniref:RDD family protein n=1 Tax=Reyranella sp. TaxID=1929291 RepID=UPI001ACEEBB1|nr:RDD family protein [Reyranella sp.]MBN9091102.1 RDD family protein [Reyranella sp.]